MLVNPMATYVEDLVVGAHRVVAAVVTVDLLRVEILFGQ